MLNDETGFSHIYLCTGYTDFRNGIDGLIAIVNGTFGLDPTEEGSIFLFERDGWLLYYKRLTGDGHFQWPRNEQEAKQLSPQQFCWLMEDLSIEQKKAISPLKPDLY